jgi:hypothetical protein
VLEAVKREEEMMRKLLVLAVVVLLSGCFFVVKDGERVKVYGENKELALDVLNKTEEVYSPPKATVDNPELPTPMK